MTWPWTNLKKLLEKRQEEFNTEKTYTIEEIIEEFRNRKPLPWYKKMYLHTWWRLNDCAWYLYRLWRPCHNSVRKSIPKHWIGYDELILAMNFAAFVEYYTKSYLAYDRDESLYTTEFNEWVEDTINYISVRRGRMLKKIDDTWPTEAELHDKDARKDLYARVHELEKELYDKDTEYLSGIIKHREQLWS